ncbi:MAG: hypothetical protein GY851_27365 [bacterium]|nr:hypothetical protein [bacterium]
MRKRGGSNCDQHLDKPELLFSPEGSQIYPEYLKDVSVMVCPADSDGTEVLEENLWHCQGRADQPICPCLMEPVSYLYYSRVIYPGYYLMNPADVNTTDTSFAWLNPSFAAQFTKMVDDLVAEPPVVDVYRREVTCVTPPYLRCVPVHVNGERGADVAYYTGAMYRLREGIERFFITDIGNPAATATADADIVVLHEKVDPPVARGIASAKAGFDHRPVGGNVLYMDGHVEFIEYPGKWPICSSWALFLDSLDEGLPE